jgi:hypothetical protein
MQDTYPPLPPLVEPLRIYFRQLLELYRAYIGVLTGATVLDRITSNTGNIESVLHLGLQKSSPDLTETIQCTLSFNRFHRSTGHSNTSLLDYIPDLLSYLGDDKLEAVFIVELLVSWYEGHIKDPQPLIQKAHNLFAKFDDPALECRFNALTLCSSPLMCFPIHS